MKIKKFISVIPALCLLLAAFAQPTAGAVEGKNVTSGAVVEVYSGNHLDRTINAGSVAEGWAIVRQNITTSNQVVMTMGADWEENELLTIEEKTNVVIDLNGHYIRRKFEDSDTVRNGEIFLVKEKAVFELRDSNPKSQGYDGVKGGVIAGGQSSNSAGGVHIEEDAHFRMTGGTIYDCKTDEDGGAVYVDGSSDNTKFTMTGGRIYGCKTVDSADNCLGGAVYLRRGTVDISNAKIDSCYSEDDGGAIYSERGKVTLKNVVFAGNKALELGGAIYTAHDTAKYIATVVNAYDCIFVCNRAEQDGGAVYINDNPEHGQAVVFHNCKFRNNSAAKKGGAVFICDDNVALSNCEITGNIAEEPGGGVFVDDRYNITLRGLTVIKDNISSKSKGVADLALEDGNMGTARIINAGLYKGSVVYVGSTANKKVKLSEWVSRYQAQYFKSNDGTIVAGEERTVDAGWTSSGSIFANGGFVTISIIVFAGLIGTAILIIYKKKKNKKNNVTEGGEENDDNN